MTAIIKVKVQRKAIVKFKVLPKFPASVIGGMGILITKAGAVYTIAVDPSALVIDVSSSTIAGVLGAINGGPPGNPILVTAASASITAKTAAVAVQRTAPTTTALALPAVSAQSGIPLRIIDWSSSVTGHTITLTPSGIETIMLLATWPIRSNAAQLGSVTLYPSTTLNGWFIAP